GRDRAARARARSAAPRVRASPRRARRTVTIETLDTLRSRIDAAIRARDQLRSRPVADTIDALVAAAARWREDRDVAEGLAASARLSPPVIAAGIDFAEEAIDASTLAGLAEREWGPGATSKPRPGGPELVAHVLASNVPALALPAIALGCLAGAAVVVKSGRRDSISAPALQPALPPVDPGPPATALPAHWPGGDAPREDDVLARADVVVVTGGPVALRALAPRLRRAVVEHGPRVSAAVVARRALTDGAAVAEALALDVAMHDQRGCLSPHAVWVEG